METRQDRLNEAQLFDECINPNVQEQVFKYLLDDLDDEHEAEAVEDHLLECRYCRDTFLTMLNVRVEANGARNLRDGAGSPAPTDSQVLRLADSKKQGKEENTPMPRAKSVGGPSK
jgi:hypothetical protein